MVPLFDWSTCTFLGSLDFRPTLFIKPAVIKMHKHTVIFTSFICLYLKPVTEFTAIILGFAQILHTCLITKYPNPAEISYKLLLLLLGRGACRDFWSTFFL